MSADTTIILPVNAAGEYTSLAPTSISSPWAYKEKISLTIDQSSGSIPQGDYVLALIYPKTPKASQVVLATTDDDDSTALSFANTQLTGMLNLDVAAIATALEEAAGDEIACWVTLWDATSEALVMRAEVAICDNPKTVII